MSASPILIFDFDSTLVQFETLDALADMVLASDPGSAALRAQIAELTDQAMAGEIEFGDALRRRLALLPLQREHIEALADRAVSALTPSVKRNIEFFETHADRILIISGGFREVIAPVARYLGIAPERVLANDFRYDDEGRVIGLDDANPLSLENGKPKAIAALGLTDPVVMIGDGWNDAEVKLAGSAERFYAFTEVVRRERVVDVADAEAASLDEILYAEGLSGRWSFPRSRIRILLLENTHPVGVERLKEAGYSVETVKGALDEDDLIEKIKGVHVLGIRSKTNVSARVLAEADRLMAIAAFCIGTNQIDLTAAADHGVPVFNAPYSNTRSVVELAIGLTITLMRDVVDKSAAMHEGKWNKSADGSRELRGKTLGIVGYGAIGSQLSVLAEAMGMRVVFYDLAERLALGNARRMRSLDDLLAEADVISLHVDGRRENTNIFGAAEFSKMKPGVLFLNLSRGHVVDIGALSQAMGSGRVAGAAVDVFPEEPRTNQDPFDSALRGLKNMILTPHIGGSTEEAQEAIAEFAA
ncbi:MAG: phosphoglycerate dehydrogenase, partial [Brevundimonas sp.]